MTAPTSHLSVTTPEPSLAEAALRVAKLAPVAGSELAAWIAALHRAIDAEAERDKLRRQAARAIMDHLRRARAACAVDPYSSDVIAWAEMESVR